MDNQTTQILGQMEGFHNSFKHKLNRIQKQIHFKRLKNHLFIRLTKREVEIVKLVVRDFNNPQIADNLFISRRTVEQHRKNINKKLSVRSFFQLFQYALAFDLI